MDPKGFACADMVPCVDLSLLGMDRWRWSVYSSSVIYKEVDGFFSLGWYRL